MWLLENLKSHIDRPIFVACIIFLLDSVGLENGGSFKNKENLG